MSETGDDRDPIEVLADSFLGRFRRGQRPSVEEYVRRYPALADDIRELLPALVLLEQGKSAAGEATGPAVGTVPLAGAETPRLLGDYMILREIGRGGMGVVYEAVQQSLGRHVALKVLPSAGPSGPALERFRLEARSAARLHHTNIVPVFGVGEEEGVAYYAMQFILGQGLDVVIDELRRRNREARVPGAAGGEAVAGQLAEALTRGFSAPPTGPRPDEATEAAAPTAAAGGTTEAIDPVIRGSSGDCPAAAERPGLDSDLSSAPSEAHYHRGVARLGIQVAEALAYAHGEGILHRDIKPSNLLLDTRGVAWVADFGLAKAEGSDGPTRTGDIVGTLRYMAPERFDGRSDPRSDIYGLGATLYELLTLRAPFEDTDRVRLIERVLHGTPEPPRKADPRIPRDLETIVLKALAREPNDRYATAGQMAEDLRLFLADRPILARRASVTERAARWCRRNPALAAASGLAFAGLVAAVATLAISNHRIRERSLALRLAVREKDGALQGRTRALGDKETALVAARREEQRANRNATRAVAQERLARAQERLARSRFYSSQVNLAGQAEESGDVARALTLLEGQRPRPGEDDPRTFEWYHLWSRANSALVRELRGPTDVIFRIALAPDGRTLAVAQSTGLSLWDITTGARLGHLVTGSWCWAVVWSPSGERLATGSSDGLVRIWDPASRRVAAEYRSSSLIRSLAWSPDGRAVAAGLDERPGAAVEVVGTIAVLDPTSGNELTRFEDHQGPVLALGFSPDGRTLATGSGFGKDYCSVSLWDWRAGRQLWHRVKTGAEGVLDFSPDGRTLVGCYDHSKLKVLLLDAADGHPTAEFKGHRSEVLGAASTPDRRTLISVSQDRTVRAWDVATGQSRILGAHSQQIYTVVVARDGRLVMTGDGAGVVRVWDLQAEPVPDRYDAQRVRGVGFTPDGRGLVVGGEGPTRLLDPATLKVRATLPGTDALEVSARGDRLALGDRDPALIRIFDLSAGRELCTILRENRAGQFAPDGRTGVLFRPYGHRSVQVWNLDNGKLSETIEFPGTESIIDVAYAPDGGRLAVGCQFRDVAIYQFATHSWRRRDVVGANLVKVLAVAFSPDGRSLAAGLDSGTAMLLDAESLAVRARLEGHGAAVVGLAFAPDGRTVASVGADLTIRLWDPETGQERLALPCEQTAQRIAFAPDGRTLVNWNGKAPLRVWRAAAGPLAAARRENVVGLDPESAREQEEAANSFWSTGRTDEAETAFRRALTRLEAANGAEATGPAGREQRAGVRAALALLLAETGRRDESHELQRDAVTEARQLPHDTRHVLALSLIERSRSLRGRGRADVALAALDLAEEVAPEDDQEVRSLAAGIKAEAGH